MRTKRHTTTLARVRMSNDSMKAANIRKGDVVRIKLGERPKQDELCVAFTAWDELVVRYFQKLPGGDIQLTTGLNGKVIQVFTPRAVMIFGRVVRVERKGRIVENYRKGLAAEEEGGER